MRWSATRGMMLNNIIAIMAGVSKKKYITATGGTITRDGNFLVHTFTGNDTLNITQVSNDPTYNTLEYLIVAGGGGGGYDIGGGGGAGGLLKSSLIPTINSFSVVIGAGGTGSTSNVQPSSNSNGNSSTAFGLTAVRGGGGGNNEGTNPNYGGGASGGSGGGSGEGIYNGGTGTSGQGNNGGIASDSAPNYGGAGGGGASAVGGNGLSTSGGAGGNGLAYTISGTSKYYAGGGGGGSFAGGSGIGGLGGGGTAGTSATANTGGGGGGGRLTPNLQTGGNGGSGIVIVRYYSPALITQNNIFAYGGVNSASTTTTSSINAKLIVLTIQSYSLGAFPTVSDNIGNTWTLVGSAQGSSAARISTFYCINPTTSAAHTFAVNAGSGYPSISVNLFSGASFTFGSFNSNTGGNLTSITPGSITPSSSNNLIITAVNYWTSGTPNSITDGFIITNSIPPTANTLAGSTAYKVNSSATNPTWAWTGGSGDTAAMITCFNY